MDVDEMYDLLIQDPEIQPLIVMMGSSVAQDIMVPLIMEHIQVIFILLIHFNG